MDTYTEGSPVVDSYEDHYFQLICREEQHLQFLFHARCFVILKSEVWKHHIPHYEQCEFRNTEHIAKK